MKLDLKGEEDRDGRERNGSNIQEIARDIRMELKTLKKRQRIETSSSQEMDKRLDAGGKRRK